MFRHDTRKGAYWRGHGKKILPNMIRTSFKNTFFFKHLKILINCEIGV